MAARERAGRGRARAAEAKVEELGQELEKYGSMNIEEIKAKNEELLKSLDAERGKYENLSTISSHGFIDPDLRDLIEWQHSRAMKDKPEKERQSLGEWLEALKADPESAPTTLRHHLMPKGEAGSPPSVEEKRAPLPSTNKGVKNTETSNGNSIDEILSNPDLYRKNQDKVRDWVKNRGKSIVW